MSLDYKTVQRLAASGPAPADGFCPECGRPWVVPTPARSGGSATLPWWGLFLTDVGAALALAFGWRAASAHRTEAAIRGNIADATRGLGGAAAIPACPPSEELAVWLSASEKSLGVARGATGRRARRDRPRPAGTATLCRPAGPPRHRARARGVACPGGRAGRGGRGAAAPARGGGAGAVRDFQAASAPLAPTPGRAARRTA
jgi:hypothetical protein